MTLEASYLCKSTENHTCLDYSVDIVSYSFLARTLSGMTVYDDYQKPLR